MTEPAFNGVLILNGTIGAGKTTVGLAIHDHLSAAECPHAFLDLDRLTDTWPARGRFNQDLLFETLGALLPVYRTNGATRLVFSRVVESEPELTRFRELLAPSPVSLIRLTCPESQRSARIREREFGESRTWHLDRTIELETILTRSALDDHVIVNDGYSPDVTAVKVLERIGWT